ncbi:hypothetical protein [Spiroplasma alleghenense]|uniref:Uncharacterized protein n=1 Tax=Spiroplasma alleghenense TaxID=216931 RepID=A0A345Z4Y8_9MOLU|nr:hypothetical protein [Spiroplasma alleghenense]AXK51667.1 hypothetical protein SALLE_v1c09970 [Spiroplasma alleghenense]
MYFKILLAAIQTGPSIFGMAQLSNTELLQEKNYQDLNILIKENDFGKITDVSETKLNNYLEKKYSIDTTQIHYTSMSYGGVRVTANEDSRIYFGTKYVTYSSELSFKYDLQTKELYAHAYDSKQSDKEAVEIEYTPYLGKEKFLDYFGFIQFEWIAKTWENGKGQKHGDWYHNDYGDDGVIKYNTKNNIKENKDKIVTKKKTYIMNSSSMSRTMLYSRIYNNVNYMKSYGFFGYRWAGDTITLQFDVETETYATAWNAYWASAKNQLFVYNLQFVKK